MSVKILQIAAASHLHICMSNIFAVETLTPGLHCLELQYRREAIRREVAAYIEATVCFEEKIPDRPPPQP